MRPNPISLVTSLLFLCLSAIGQTEQRFDLLLKSGTILPQKNITSDRINEFNSKTSRTENKTFAIIQFEQLPSEQDKIDLKNSGIELLDYIPNNAYTVCIEGSLDETILLRTKARSIFEPSPENKMHESLASGNFPSWAVKVQGTVDVWISFPRTFNSASVIKELKARNFEITSDIFRSYNILCLRVSAHRLFELASYPFVEYVEPAPGEDKPLNGWTNWNRDGSKASLLNAPLAVGGKNLKGTGVVIGVGDNSDPQSHPDFSARIISRAATLNRMHGAHVSGIVGGSGIRDELRMGFAPKSTIVQQYFNGILNNAAAYVQDFGMVITNNSYGNLDECSFHGLYDLYARIMDEQAFSLPNLQHVFAAGNSGSQSCAPFASGFRTVLGGYQSAKNVITVGNAPPNGNLFATSSRGPVRDGRIKPEITTVGSFIVSCAPNPPYNYYAENTGTSMAAPGVAGGAGLIYERFRQLTGTNPRNVVVKALLCNGADDRGNDGPDFRHGFGFMNLWRSVEMLENNHIDTAFIATGNTNNININVPAGLSKLKVMLVWNDPAASVLASRTLVNDLDLEVVNPSANTILPRLLDTIPSNVDLIAGSGADHLNNIEQVTIDNPDPGNYTIKVKGTAVPQNGPQQYVVVYDYVPNDIRVVGPVGGDTYIPGERILIQWDSHGDPTSTFKLEYSLDGGTNWSVLDANIPADIRFWITGPDVGFLVPNVATTQALVRVTKNATGASHTSFPFTILTQPVVSLASESTQCEGYINMNWSGVTGATDYEVMILQGSEMISVGTTTGNNYIFKGLSKDSTYWVTVRARMNGIPGRRAIALSRKPNTGSCNGGISNGDIQLDAIVSPVSSGRVFTSTSLGNNLPVTIRIKNLGSATTTGNITASYSLNGGPQVTEIISNPNIPGGGTLNYTFLAGNINLSATGTYLIDASVTGTGDPVSQNNSLSKTFKQLPNPAITSIIYPVTFIENFDAAPIQSINRNQIGLTGLDRYDFVNSSELGRARTFINTGLAYSGNRAITLDAEMYNAGNTDSLTGTFNLTGFNAATEDIRLDFRYKNHGQESNPANKVWIRGDDTKPWLQALDLYSNQNDVDGSYKFSGSIEIADLLNNSTQNFSSSFQVRFGQFGMQQAADNFGSAGYTIDDIRIYKVTNDVQMVSVDEPISNSCNLNANTVIKVTVRNSSNSSINNIPVRYRIDGGAYTPTETISSIGANSSEQYTFSTRANLSTPGAHTIEAQVLYATDSYNENDTVSVTIVNSPLISVTGTSPYLQTFESGNGSWYSGGKLNSWEYGTPASYKINKAASGTKAWKTRLSGAYNDKEKSYLYSPCFNISSMSSPTLSFSLALDIEDCGTGSFCDGAYVEYSSNGTTWTRLGAYNQGTNWYNRNYSSNNVWSAENYTRWHVASIPLPTGISQLRLRFVMSSDESVNKDGIAVDDIHIYDNPYGIYTGTGSSPVISQPVSGSNWVHFVSGGKLIASINPNNVNMGVTSVQSFVNTSAVRYTTTQYYHDRNITIKPTTVNLTDSATVRFYFTDSETEALINATGCATCIKPTSGYDLGVSKYSDPNDNFENGTIADNNQGTWSYITSINALKVPFDRGYYAQFKVKDFSEFWLNNGGFFNGQSLPLKLISFTARKKDQKDVLVEWNTESESDVNRFEIEVAKGNSGYQQTSFIKIGEVPARNNGLPSQYSFTDLELNKKDVRFYRLKMINNDGSFGYSPVRPIVFSEEFTWMIYPNPSSGVFHLSYQANVGENITVRLFDLSGKTIKQNELKADGFIQKLIIDLNEAKFAKGLYLLEISSESKKQTFRLIKQ